MSNADLEPRHTIGVVSRRTGLSQHVLRAWERRYGVVEPTRRDGGSRLYSDADIVHLRLLRRLTQGGHAISNVAPLPLEELLRLDAAAADDAPPAQRELREFAEAGAPYLAKAMVAVEAMDAPGLRAVLTSAVLALSPRGFLEGMLIPLLRRAGDLWAQGGICAAHEHLLSVQVTRVLGWLAETIPVPSGAPVAVAATPAGQRHEFGALMASVVAAEAGWAVAYLGPDLPADDLVTAVRTRDATLLLLSAIVGPDERDGGDEIRRIAQGMGERVQVLVGGAGAEGIADEGPAAGVRWLPDLEALRVELHELGGAR